MEQRLGVALASYSERKAPKAAAFAVAGEATRAGSVAEEEAEIAAARAPESAGESGGAAVALSASASGDDAPWPTDEAGGISLAAAGEIGAGRVSPPVVAVRDEAVEDRGPLPTLDTLVARIPAEVRETLEDLFRVKFTTVRRVPAKHIER